MSTGSFTGAHPDPTPTRPSTPLRLLCLAWIWLLFWAPAAGLAQERGLPPELGVEGRVTARDISLRIACVALAGTETALECRVTARGQLQAEEDGARVCPGPCNTRALPYLHAVVDGELLREARTLSRGERVEVETEARFPLSVERGWAAVLTQPPLGVRHPLFGESWLSYDSAQTIQLRPFAGSGIEARGAATVDVSGPAGVWVRVNGRRHRGRGRAAPGVPRVEVELRPPHGGPPSGPLAHGGPVVTLGGRFALPRAPVAFFLGIGYELGLVDYLVVSAWLETDFVETASEALVIEVAAPGLVYLVPSLSAGVGVVARQHATQGADAGLRLRLGASFFVAGLVCDFDYWAVSEAWSATVSARLGL